MAKIEKRLEAERLFLSTKMTAKDIAETVGVTEKTVGKWKNQYNWVELKGANVLSQSQIVKNLLLRAKEESEKEEPNADKLAKWSATIQRLSVDKTPITAYTDVLIEVTDFIKARNFEHGQLLNRYMKEFMSEKINHL